MPFVGESIALITVLCWTISIQFFEAASKRVGAIPVNVIRIATALLLFTLLSIVRNGYIIPIHFPASAWLYLSLSGAIGFFIGDIFLFKALVEIGPRVSMLIFSLSAPTAALIGPFLGVSLSLLVLHYLSVGVASTFLSLVPICIIPFSIYLHKEHVSIRAFGGAVIAVCGIFLLMSP